MTQLAYAFPALLLPVLIIIFLRFGIATPTEVSIMSHALCASRVLAGVSRHELRSACTAAVIEAGIATGVVLLVIMASSAVGWIITFEQLPVAFAEYREEHAA